MHHTGNGGTSAVFHVGCGSGNGSGSRNSSEQCGSNVAGTLGDQFHVGAVSTIHHAVCHHTGKQRLDSRQNSDGESIRQDILYGLQAEGRQRNCRELIGDLIQISDGVYIHIKQCYHGTSHQYCNQ